MKPLPATQRVTAGVIMKGARRTMIEMMSWVRTCRGARQILLRWRLLLLLLLTRWLTVGVCVAGRRQRLAVGAVHGRRLANAAPDGVGRHKGLGLG